MTEERPQSKFKKGDIVRVVDEPYEDCPFEWIGEMDDCCGKEAVITDMIWFGHRGIWGYYLDIDEYDCKWCENCFVVEPDLVESDLHPLALFQ